MSSRNSKPSERDASSPSKRSPSKNTTLNKSRSSSPYPGGTLNTDRAKGSRPYSKKASMNAVSSPERKERLKMRSRTPDPTQRLS